MFPLTLVIYSYLITFPVALCGYPLAWESVSVMKKITDFEELECRRLAVQLYQDMTAMTKKKKIDCNDELVCRRLIS